jgi:transcriptional regulator with XRE-family HTH domain
MSFGRVLNDARKSANLTQRDLAAQVLKEDGQPISAPYLHDIEHDRRNPPSPYLIEQLAKALAIDADVLYYWAGVLPDDVRRTDVSDKKIRSAFRAFRNAINK